MGTSTAGSPICVGEQGVHEDVSRKLFDLEVSDFKSKEETYLQKIRDLEAQENATKTLIGMRDAAWESAFTQIKQIAKMALLAHPNKDVVEGMIDNIKTPTELGQGSVSVSESPNMAAKEL